MWEGWGGESVRNTRLGHGRGGGGKVRKKWGQSMGGAQNSRWEYSKFLRTPSPPPLGHKFWPVPKFPFWLNKEISYSKHRIRKSSFQNVVFNPITRLNPIIYNIVEQWCWLKGCWAFKPLFKQGDKGRYEITNDDYVLNTITTDHESRITNDFCLIII